MLYTINQLKDTVYEKALGVFQVFVDYYGEQFTDLQGIPHDDVLKGILASHYDIEEQPDMEGHYDIPQETLDNIRSFLNKNLRILVWWPTVTITNENNRSITVKDLYVKVLIDNEGKIPIEYAGFKIARSTFTRKQLLHNYVHSHASPSFYNEMPKFRAVCLGRGPIKDTIDSLKLECDTVMWMLFCEELARYVTVESLQGIPYVRLEGVVGCSDIDYEYNDYSNYYSDIQYFNNVYKNNFKFGDALREFTRWYIDNCNLTFSFVNGSFVCGMSFYDYIVSVSNAFISWYNQSSVSDEEVTSFILDGNRVLRQVKISNGKIYKNNIYVTHAYDQFEGQFMFRFRGSEVLFHISDVDTGQEETTLLLDKQAAMYIICNILKVINYRYKNKHNESAAESTTGTSAYYEKVIYI